MNHRSIADWLASTIKIESTFAMNVKHVKETNTIGEKLGHGVKGVIIQSDWSILVKRADEMEADQVLHALRSDSHCVVSNCSESGRFKV